MIEIPRPRIGKKPLTPLQREALLRRQAKAARKKVTQVPALFIPQRILSRAEIAKRENAMRKGHEAEERSLRKPRGR